MEGQSRYLHLLFQYVAPACPSWFVIFGRLQGTTLLHSRVSHMGGGWLKDWTWNTS